MHPRPDAQRIRKEPPESKQQRGHGDESKHSPNRRTQREDVTMHHNQTDESQERDKRDGHIDRGRPEHSDQAEDVEETGVGRGIQRRKIGIGKNAGDLECMFTRVLQRPGVDVLEIVAGRVIERSRIREREIEAGQPQLSIDGEIRVVGQQFVDFVAHGTGRRSRNGVGKEIHEPRVAGSGFEHHARARPAARFEIHHHADTAHQRMAFGKGARSAQARLLAVGDQKDDIVPGRPGGEGTSELEHHGNARAVVADARSRCDAVVVRACEHGFAVARSLVHGDDVFNRGAAGIALGGTALQDRLHFGRVSRELELGNDPVAHDGVFRRPGRMRPLLSQQSRKRRKRMFLGECGIGRARRRDQLRLP